MRIDEGLKSLPEKRTKETDWEMQVSSFTDSASIY